MENTIETTSRSNALRGLQPMEHFLGWLVAALLMATLFLMGTGTAFASGTGHSHDEPSSTSVESPMSSDQGGASHEHAVEETSGHHSDQEPGGHHDEERSMDADGDDHHADVLDGHHGDDAMNAEMSEHDHASHEDGTWAKNGFQRLLAWVGKFHPAATNFPIALLLAAAFAEFLFLSTQNSAFRQAARFCLWAGAVSALGTALLGWFFVGFDFSADDAVLSAHRWNGTATAFISLIALGLGERAFVGRGSIILFRIVLVVVALMAGFNGLLGGKMVYGEDHYEWPTSE